MPLHQTIRTTVLCCCLLVMTGCDLDKIANGSDVLAGTGISAEMVDFSRSGGEGCSGTKPDEDSKCATVHITYPKISDTLAPETAARINQFIQEQLLEYSDNEGKQPASLDELANLFIGDYLKDPSPIGHWELERNMEAVYAHDGLVTLSLSENGYTGGAHPFNGQRYFVLDMQSGKQLTLNDLLSPGYEGTLNTAGERAFRATRELSPDASLEAEGFWFDNDTFKVNTNFGVLADGLGFVFNAYEVAPYAMGPTEFTIPYEDIRALIPENSPLASIAR